MECAKRQALMNIPFDNDSSILSFSNEHPSNHFQGSLEVLQETFAVDATLTCDTNYNTEPAMNTQVPQHTNTQEFRYDLKGMHNGDKFTNSLFYS
jgi:hypothetical protein